MLSGGSDGNDGGLRTPMSDDLDASPRMAFYSPALAPSPRDSDLASSTSSLQLASSMSAVTPLRSHGSAHQDEVRTNARTHARTHAHVRAVTSYSSYSSYESTKLTRAMWPTVHVGGRYHEMMSHIGEWERRVNSNGGSTHTGSTRYRGFFVHVHTKTTTATAVGSIMLLLPRAEQDICNTINPKTTRVASERASERTRMRCISECLLMICVYLLSRVITKKFVAMEHAVDGRELLWNLQLCVRVVRCESQRARDG